MKIFFISMALWVNGVTWIAGVVLAEGSWKIAAVCVPPYAWYLFTERVMQMIGMI